jgi:NAD-dependent SIR2 family protein deacetylase
MQLDATTQDRIKQLITNAEGVVILAGAGMSVDSGLPDFRGSTGMWTQAKEEFITLASGKGFEQDPVRVWNFYRERIVKYAHTEPHTGYQELRELLQRLNKPTFVVTSNVDGAFVRARYDANQIYEMHGSLAWAQCAVNCRRQLVCMPEMHVKPYHTVTDLPRCDACGALMRPNVMMFGDKHLTWQHIDRGLDAYRSWSAPMLNVVGIEIGAGVGIPSLRIFGEEKTTTLIRINPHDVDMNRPQDVIIQMTALEGIQQLVQLFE